MSDIPAGWEISQDGKSIEKEFKAKSYWQTIGMVNAVAWIAQAENHHPDMIWER